MSSAASEFCFAAIFLHGFCKHQSSVVVFIKNDKVEIVFSYTYRYL